MKKGYDIVFTARAAASEADYSQILNSMLRSLERARLIGKVNREKK